MEIVDSASCPHSTAVAVLRQLWPFALERSEVGTSRPADPGYLDEGQIRKGGYGRKGSQGAEPPS